MNAYKSGQLKCFKENDIVFMEKVDGSALELSSKMLFKLDKYWRKIMGWK